MSALHDPKSEPVYRIQFAFTDEQEQFYAALRRFLTAAKGSAWRAVPCHRRRGDYQRVGEANVIVDRKIEIYWGLSGQESSASLAS